MDLRFYIKYFSAFLFFVFVQIIFLSNIKVSTLGITPYIYIAFILLLPIRSPQWGILIISFIVGLVVDLFYDTHGIHAAASTLAAFLRPWFLKILAPYDGYEANDLPRIKILGFKWFSMYTFLMLFVHNSAVILITKAGIQSFFLILSEIIATIIFSYSFIIISQYFIFKE